MFTQVSSTQAKTFATIAYIKTQTPRYLKYYYFSIIINQTEPSGLEKYCISSNKHPSAHLNFWLKEGALTRIELNRGGHLIGDY